MVFAVPKIDPPQIGPRMTIKQGQTLRSLWPAREAPSCFSAVFRLFYRHFARTPSAPSSAIVQLFSRLDIPHVSSWLQRLQDKETTRTNKCLGRKKQHKHKLFGPDFLRTFLTLTPGCPGVKKFLLTTGAAGKTHFLVRTSTIFGADVHDPKGC